MARKFDRQSKLHAIRMALEEGNSWSGVWASALALSVMAIHNYGSRDDLLAAH